MQLENPDMEQFSQHLKYIKRKVKESHTRLSVAQRVPEGLGSQIFMTFGT